MDMEQAMDEGTKISVPEAVKEIQKHHFRTDLRDVHTVHKQGTREAIVSVNPWDTSDYEVIAWVDNEGNVNSLDVMEWLGY